MFSTYPIADLPELEEITFGWNSMTQLNSLNFTALPKLKKITSLSGPQRRDVVPSNWGTMVLSDLPTLQEIRLQGSSLMNFDALELRNLPKLECFVFEVQEESFMYSLKFNSCFNFPL